MLVLISIIFFVLACVATPTAPTSPPPPQPRNVIVSDEHIDVDWADPSNSSTRDEVMDVLQSNLRRYRYYHIHYATLENSATTNWINRIRFITYSNPHQFDVRMVFNYFSITYSFSNTQLSWSGGQLSRESPYYTGSSLRVFTRDVNEVLSRASLEMRGKTFGNNRMHQFDLLWLEALRFRD